MRVRSLLVGALLLCTGAACAGRAPVPAAGSGAVAPTAAVERFLQLVRAKDYVQMGWVFGSQEGPVIERWPRAEVEQRMYALASVLAHDSVVVGRGQPVPGRIGVAERFEIRLREGTRTYAVPVTTVMGSGRRWFVENVDVEAVTGGR